MTFRRLRILLLLGVLFAALGLTWVEQKMVRGWQAPLDVVVIPINGDGSEVSAAYIRDLKVQGFDEIRRFVERETARYGVKQVPSMLITLDPELKKHPPAPPQGGNVLSTIWWSLKLRWWVYQQSGVWMPQLGKIKLYVLFHAPQDNVPLAHSLGLQKGLIGVVHAFADSKQASQNNIVIAHELLHTLGATDKYGPGGQPIYPQGYAEPDLPLSMPRHEAEIMAGRYVAANGRVTMPSSLERCVIGAQTAHEINLDEGFKQRYSAH